MGIGVSLVLIAVGAILAYAVNYNGSAVNLDAIGVILMITGAAGLVLSLLFWSSVAPWGVHRHVDEVDHVDVVEPPAHRHTHL